MIDKRDRIGCSVRTSFPLLTTNNATNQANYDKISLFVDKVQKLIQSKCNEQIVRLGLCATCFVERASKGSSISSYFQTGGTQSSSLSSSQPLITSKNIHVETMCTENKSCKINQKGSEIDCSFKGSCNQDDYSGKKESEGLNVTVGSPSDQNLVEDKSLKQNKRHCEPQSQFTPDLAYAMKLQASYDRENEILSIDTGINHKKSKVKQNMQIDFFTKSSKNKDTLVAKEESSKKLSVDLSSPSKNGVKKSFSGSQASASRDQLYAAKLQASYDRENEILSRAAKLSSSSNSKRSTKKMRIDSFFTMKK